MKREIKFRAWEKTEKKMGVVEVLTDQGCFILGITPGKDTYLNGGKTIVVAPTDGRFVPFQECELMQFTGLKDKQGKEIYEGDILDNHFKVEWNQLHNGFALFNKKGYCHQLMADEYNLTGESLPPWQINAEVIGNIYEIPELLN